MPKISVHTPFTLTHDDSRQQRFAVGVHEVSEDIAHHWYVQEHSDVVDIEPENEPEIEPVKSRRKTQETTE